MDVKTTDFKLKLEGRMVKASLSVFQPKGSKLVYRVFLHTGGHGKVIVLYPKNREKTEFFHHPLEEKDAVLAKKLVTKIKTLSA